MFSLIATRVRVVGTSHAIKVVGVVVALHASWRVGGTQPVCCAQCTADAQNIIK